MANALLNMGEGQNLAQYTATCFAEFFWASMKLTFINLLALGTERPLQLVWYTRQTKPTGDLVVEVRDPADSSRGPLRSDRLMIVFGASVPFSKVVSHRIKSKIGTDSNKRRRLISLNSGICC